MTDGFANANLSAALNDASSGIEPLIETEQRTLDIVSTFAIANREKKLAAAQYQKDLLRTIVRTEDMDTVLARFGLIEESMHEVREANPEANSQELFEKLQAPYYAFHDRDVAPEGATLAESHRNFDELIQYC